MSSERSVSKKRGSEKDENNENWRHPAGNTARSDGDGTDGERIKHTGQSRSDYSIAVCSY